MKVLKTIVATAVIVFALTTVAMAGVQRLGGGDQTPSPAAAGPAATAPQTQAQATVTLTTRQFARLMRAATGGAAHRQTDSRDRDRDNDRERDRSHTSDSGVGSSGNAASSATPPATHSYDSGEHHSGDQGGGCE